MGRIILVQLPKSEISADSCQNLGPSVLLIISDIYNQGTRRTPDLGSALRKDVVPLCSTVLQPSKIVQTFIIN